MGNAASGKQHVQDVSRQGRRKSRAGKKRISAVRQFLDFDLETGDQIHVLDSFKSKKDNRAKYKWRRAEVSKAYPFTPRR